jgi:hypothetical protein
VGDVVLELLWNVVVEKWGVCNVLIAGELDPKDFMVKDLGSRFQVPGSRFQVPGSRF